jgi:membrane protein involved in colicin uptake
MKFSQIIGALVVILFLCAIGYISYKISNPGAGVAGLGLLGAIWQGWRKILFGSESAALAEKVSGVEQNYEQQITGLRQELAAKQQVIDRLTYEKLSLLESQKQQQLQIIADQTAQNRQEAQQTYDASLSLINDAHKKYEETGDLSGYRQFLQSRGLL